MSSMSSIAIKIFTIFNLMCAFTLSANIEAPRYEINLDQPLEPQFAKVYPRFKETLNEYVEVVKNNVYGSKYFIAIAKAITYFQDNKWHEEIAMYSRITGIPEAILMVGNLTYEIQCTSIVLKNTDGGIFMGRNLDFPGPYYLSRMSVVYAFYKGGKYLYEYATQFANLGIVNGVSFGKFALSINRRDKGKNFLGKLGRIAMGYPDSSRFLRTVVETAQSYEEAVHMLSFEPVAASVYYIIGGSKDNEGAVIARDHNGPVLVDRLSNSTWFLVQTNYDRNKPDPERDYRRVPAEEKIAKIGKSISFQDLYDVVMTQPPTFRNTTILTTIQSASNGSYFNTTVYIN